MQNVNISLEQGWDTLDEAIAYFLDIVLDLQALKRLPELPTNLFLLIETGSKELNDKQRDELNITLTNL